jgi:hypothetical protein
MGLDMPRCKICTMAYMLLLKLLIKKRTVQMMWPIVNELFHMVSCMKNGDGIGSSFLNKFLGLKWKPSENKFDVLLV